MEEVAFELSVEEWAAFQNGKGRQRLSRLWEENALYNNIYVIQSREQRAEISQSQLPRQGDGEERWSQGGWPCLPCLQACLSEVETPISDSQHSLPLSSVPYGAQFPLHSTSLAETVKGCDLSPSLHSTQLSFWTHSIRQGILWCPLWDPDHTNCLDGAFWFTKLVASVTAIATRMRQLGPRDIQWHPRSHSKFFTWRRGVMNSNPLLQSLSQSIRETCGCAHQHMPLRATHEKWFLLQMKKLAMMNLPLI